MRGLYIFQLLSSIYKVWKYLNTDTYNKMSRKLNNIQRHAYFYEDTEY
jgi:hypothetical protein